MPRGAIDEETRRILTRRDVVNLRKVRQLCSGLNAGIKGSVHAMRELYDKHHGNGLGAASCGCKNSFNLLNRAAALWNVRILWP